MCVSPFSQHLISRRREIECLVPIWTGLRTGLSGVLQAQVTEPTRRQEVHSRGLPATPPHSHASRPRKGRNCRLDATIWALSAPEVKKMVLLLLSDSLCDSLVSFFLSEALFFGGREEPWSDQLFVTR